MPNTKSFNTFIESQYLTGDPMSVFFTLTFANKLHLSCFDCQTHFLDNGYSSHLKGDSLKYNSTGDMTTAVKFGLNDISFNYHCHFPSYSYVLSVARDLSSFFASKNTQLVVEGDPDYLKKYDAYMDEHKIKPLFSKKDNTRVTRPHVHGVIDGITKDNFHKSLEKSKYFTEFWQPGCSCFEPKIEKNNDWVYRKKPLMEFVDGKCHDTTHLVPKKARKPVGFYNIQEVHNRDAVQNYIQKYIDKGGSDVRIF